MNKIILTTTLLLVTVFGAGGAEANSCWFDSYGNVQNGWLADYNIYSNTTYCCPYGTDRYDAATNKCSTWQSAYDTNWDYSSGGYGKDDSIVGYLFFGLLVGFLYWAYTEGWAGSSSSNDEPCRPAPSYEPTPVPRAQRPKVVMHDFNPKPPKKPDIVYVTKDGAVAKPEKPAPAPAPEAKPVERPAVNPTGNDFVKRRADEYINDWGMPPDRAARVAQDEFKGLNLDKQKREAKAREGVPPRKT